MTRSCRELAVSALRGAPVLVSLSLAAACGPDDSPAFHVEDDQVAPGAVLDLRVSSRDDSVLTLLWTSPGDDGSEGRAWLYDMRRSAVPIDEAGWAAATSINGEPAPSLAGRSEIFLLLGLGPTERFYFALRTEDEWGNRSGLSNVAEAVPLDRISPGRVVDLVASPEGPTDIVLTWTATGDDGAEGRATGYVIRWAEFALDETNFGQGVLVSPAPVPEPAGGTESYRIAIDAAGPQSFWFALEVWDEVNQSGPLSNVARVDRPGGPVNQDGRRS